MNIATTCQIVSTSSDATEKLGEQVGKRLKGGEVIELISDLGGGKTTFIRGLARGMGSTDHVSSPTFTISKFYSVKPKPQTTHLDAALGADAERNEAYMNTLSEHRKSATTRSAKSSSGAASFAGRQADAVRGLWHFDFYRLSNPGHIEHELSEVVDDSNAVVVIEWAAIVSGVLPKKRLSIFIKTISTNKRKITLKCDPSKSYLLENLC